MGWFWRSSCRIVSVISTACTFLILVIAYATSRANFGSQQLDSTAPQSSRACKWGGRDGAASAAADRSEARQCDACQSAPKVPRRSCVETSPVYIYYTRTTTLLALALLPGEPAIDSPPATSAAGKLQGALNAMICAFVRA